MNNELQSENLFFKTKLKEEKIIFRDGMAMPVSLSPRVFSKTRFAELKQNCEKVLEAIEIVLNLYLNDEKFREEFPEFANCRDLTTTKPLYKRLVHYARFDISETPEGEFKMMETNTDSPGGIVFTPIIHKIHSKLPSVQRIFENLFLYEEEIEDKTIFIRSLIEKYNEAKGDNSKLPNIAFVNSQYKPIYTELELFVEIAKKIGLTATYRAIQDFKDYNGFASWDNHKIDLAYHKFDNYTDEKGLSTLCMYETEEQKANSSYAQGLDRGDFIYLNSFQSSTVGETKRMMTMLVDPKVQQYFTSDQIHAIQALCPESFCLDGEDIEHKISKALQNKDKYVLKKNFDTRGRSVVIGRLISNKDWKDMIIGAVNKAWVVQEYIPQHIYPIMNNECSDTIYVSGVIGLYLLDGKAIGASCRASSDAVTNMAKSGIAQPVYIITPEVSISDTRKIEQQITLNKENKN